METASNLGVNARLNRLMGGWRDIVEDTRQLGARIAALPDACDCTVGGGACACCATQEYTFPEACRICAERVQHLTTRIAHVLDDALRYLPAVDVMTRTAHRQLHESLREVAAAVFSLLRTMDSVHSATGEFHHGCRTAHVVALKRVAMRLSDAVEDAHARLRSV